MNYYSTDLFQRDDNEHDKARRIQQVSLLFH